MDVTEGTPAFDDTQVALALARGVIDEGVVYTRSSRSVCGRGLTRSS